MGDRQATELHACRCLPAEQVSEPHPYSSLSAESSAWKPHLRSTINPASCSPRDLSPEQIHSAEQARSVTPCSSKALAPLAPSHLWCRRISCHRLCQPGGHCSCRTPSHA